jgi:cysteinyl-tRNA synthetase
MGLFLYNTLSRQKEEFQPLTKPVRIYTCGMTVQDRPHLGHLRAYITSDVLRRYLEFSGYEVKSIQNFTDIDDKVIQRAKEENTDYRILAQRNIDEYLEVARLLNIKPATVYPRATQHIQEIIGLIEQLIAKGLAYPAEGDVYFEVKKFPGYGKLSKKKLDDLVAGARIAPDEKKRNPEDFALWKAAKPDEPWWESPWGRGRPGWHIECSAMAIHYLGVSAAGFQPIDIHTGGEDLIFPHHENEIAQAEGATGKPFARFWLHNAFLNLTGAKMSKSTKHFIAAKEVLTRFTPNAIRLYFLQCHYRSPIEYDNEWLVAAERAFERIENFLQQVEERLPLDTVLPEPSMNDFQQAMDDDLNTSKAVGVIFELVGQGFKSLESGSVPVEFYASVQKSLKVLGFGPPRRGGLRAALERYGSMMLKMEKSPSPHGSALERYAQSRMEKSPSADQQDLINHLIASRTLLRKEGKYEQADDVRKILTSLGIKIEDTKEGTRIIF